MAEAFLGGGSIREMTGSWITPRQAEDFFFFFSLFWLKQRMESAVN